MNHTTESPFSALPLKPGRIRAVEISAGFAREKLHEAAQLDAIPIPTRPEYRDRKRLEALGSAKERLRAMLAEVEAVEAALAQRYAAQYGAEPREAA